MKKTAINKSRSRNGCLTCRQRHIKCDEVLPVCKNCQRSKRTCERGCRFNFLKTISFSPQTPVDTDYSNIKFLDNSLTIHKLYRCNNFHDYSFWLREHSRQELKESDADIREGETITETPTRRYTKQRSQTANSNDNSDSEASRQSSGTLVPFNFFDFVSKVISISNRSQTTSLFVSDQREKLLSMTNGVRISAVVDDKLTLTDISHFMEKLENYVIDDFLEIGQFQMEYTALLNALNLCVKANSIDLFNQTFASSNIISGLCQITNIESWASMPSGLLMYESVHNYGNTMNFYELMLLDMNDSLKYNKPNSFRTDDDTILFLLDKVLTMNLFDDLNYALIRITNILLKLNNLRHHRQKNAVELSHIINELKELENNQFFTAYYPHVHDGSSFSSNSSTSSIGQRLAGIHHTRFDYTNMKAKRAHLTYNFTLCYILRHFPLSMSLKNRLFEPTFLNTFWNHQETDIFQRLAYISNDFDLNSDPFMNFLRG